MAILVKDCKCKETASFGIHIFNRSVKSKGGNALYVSDVYEGLGCDKCQKPWKVDNRFIFDMKKARSLVKKIIKKGRKVKA
jgi:hypothetical protein